MDDEEAVREAIGGLLTQLGHSVTLVVEGEEAVARYQIARENGTPYDVVILDLKVPGHMGGQAAAQAILAFDPNARLIVSSGYATDPVIANYQDYGFKGRVVKPFLFNSLQRAVEKVLQAT
jgi:CheY-like chemotaxis protein